MRPEEIRALRTELGCSIGELATAVGVDARTLLAWEAGDLFPTKRHVVKLQAVRTAGTEGFRRPKATSSALSGVELLSDARLWAIVRRLVDDPDFFLAVENLAGKSRTVP